MRASMVVRRRLALCRMGLRVESIAIQGDGKIVLAGYRRQWLAADIAVARLNADGPLIRTLTATLETGTETSW